VFNLHVIADDHSEIKGSSSAPFSSKRPTLLVCSFESHRLSIQRRQTSKSINETKENEICVNSSDFNDTNRLVLSSKIQGFLCDLKWRSIRSRSAADRVSIDADDDDEDEVSNGEHDEW
jgi:hypothetical protein